MRRNVKVPPVNGELFIQAAASIEDRVKRQQAFLDESARILTAEAMDVMRAMFMKGVDPKGPLWALCQYVAAEVKCVAQEDGLKTWIGEGGRRLLKAAAAAGMLPHIENKYLVGTVTLDENFRSSSDKCPAVVAASRAVKAAFSYRLKQQNGDEEDTTEDGEDTTEDGDGGTEIPF